MRCVGHDIRRATRDDVAAIQALFELDPGFFIQTEGAPPRPDEALEQLNDCPPMLALDAKHAFVVHAGESLVALLDLLQGYPVPTTWYLGLIFIAPHARGAGLGARLLESLCTHVAANGGTALRLAVVPDNHGARRLYDRLGFAFVNRRKRSAWTGAVIDCDVLERALHG